MEICDRLQTCSSCFRYHELVALLCKSCDISDLRWTLENCGDLQLIMTKANKKCFFVEWGSDDCWQANPQGPEEKNQRMVKKLMYWLLCIWDKDMWKAHQVNVIRHQQFLRLNKDGRKSIFLQFYRCYLNISIAEFTLGSAFHEGKPAILGWKNIGMKMSKHIPIANCWASDLPPDDISSTIPWKKLI